MTRRQGTSAPLLALLVTLALSSTPGHASLRLGRDVIPVEESLTLTLDPAAARFGGVASIALEVPQPADSFRFHALGLDLDSLVLRRGGEPIAVRWQRGPGGMLVVRARHPLTPGAHTLTIGFSAPFDTTALALYRVRQGDDWYAFTQFEAIEARRAFPCWDEPDFKIPWRITLRAPLADIVSANTPIAERRVQGAWQIATFEPTPPMPSYLVAFAVGPFDTLSVRGLPGPGRILSPRGTRALAAGAATQAGPLLAALERSFGRPYPYRKLDLVAAPEFAYGAMENAGLIVFVDALLLHEPGRLSPADRRRLAGIIAHEMAHMWFGDLVTMRWWDDLWLNESFASWMGDHVTDQVYPEMRVRLDQLRGRSSAYHLDALDAVRAMRRVIGDDVDLDQLADALAYQKGQALLLMFESWLGPDRFRDGVREYLREHAWGNAVGSELWSTLEVTSGEPVAAPMASFLDQPGVPLVSVESCGGGRIVLAQRRFFDHANADSSVCVWRIPVVLALWDGQRVHRQRVLLERPRQSFALEVRDPVWVHPNADETGYYRWQVPAGMFDRLAAAGPAALSERERIAMPDAAVASLAAGILHGETAVRVIERIARDPAPEAVLAALRAAERVREDYLDDRDDPDASAWLGRTFAPALARIGAVARPGEPDAATELRAGLIWELGAHGGEDALRAEGARQCAKWLADPSAVDPALAGSWLRLAARAGDTTLVATFRSRLERGAGPADRWLIVSALGQFRDPVASERVLEGLLDGTLRPQEVLDVPGQWDDSPAVRARATEWVRQHYGLIVARIPRSQWNDMVRIGEGCGEEGLAETRAFFTAPGRVSAGYREELTLRESRARACGDRRAREQTAVRRAFAAPPP